MTINRQQPRQPQQPAASAAAAAATEEEEEEEKGDGMAWLSEGSDPPPPNPRGAPLAEGVIKLSPSLTSTECRKQMNATCMGRCLESIQVRQRGPTLSLTSVAGQPMAFWPNGTRPCRCEDGYGVYSAGKRTALWYYAGPTEASPPRVFKASVETGGDGDGRRDRLVVRHAALGERGCPFVFEVASGQVMGVKGAGESPSLHAEFPIWATILLSLGSVLLLSGIAFIVIKMRPGPSSLASSSFAAARQRAAATEKKARGITGKTEDVASLTDPLLLGEEGKASDGTKA